MKNTKNQLRGQSVKDPQKHKPTPPCIGVSKSSSTKLTRKFKKSAGLSFLPSYHLWYLNLAFTALYVVYGCIAVLIQYTSWRFLKKSVCLHFFSVIYFLIPYLGDIIFSIVDKEKNTGVLPCSPVQPLGQQLVKHACFLQETTELPKAELSTHHLHPSTKIKLQLFPINEDTRIKLEKVS